MTSFHEKWNFTLTFSIGKMGSSGAFAIAYVYTAEMYPTVVRGTALGLSSLAGRIGGIIAPLVCMHARFQLLNCKIIKRLIFST